MTNKIKIVDEYGSFEEIIEDIVSSGKYQDIKYVLDLKPKREVAEIVQEYKLVKNDPDFDIEEFVGVNFSSFSNAQQKVEDKFRKKDIIKYIDNLWTELTVSSKSKNGSLLGLPHKYIVPGGRFSEQFYWDSYFVMLGLAKRGHWDLIEGMVDNFAYMINKFGFIPTANRNYFLTRSQPPVFCMMIELLANKHGSHIYKKYLKYMVKEHEFWMDGYLKKLKKSQHNAFARIVEMPGGEILNRYYDNTKTPRPESVLVDKKLSVSSKDRDPKRLYLHLRAAAESGWDFSSRWFTDGANMSTIRTSDMVPVDLNCLMYESEIVIARAYDVSGKNKKSAEYLQYADSRKAAILKYCWSEKDKFFSDYDYYTDMQTGRLSLAGAFPLLVGIASKEQAGYVASRLEKDFLKPGGLTATLHKTGQQWDSPNGWAPLQWTTVKALKKYKYDELAGRIIKRWMGTIEAVFEEQGRILEKYNVIDSSIGMGGEYTVQEGFGWTNGVYVDFSDIIKREH